MDYLIDISGSHPGPEKPTETSRNGTWAGPCSGKDRWGKACRPQVEPLDKVDAFRWTALLNPPEVTHDARYFGQAGRRLCGEKTTR
jgi:hypothetical protein